VLSSAKHLLSLINDILDISKIETGHYDLEYSHLDFKDLIEKSALFLKEQSLKNELKIQTNIEGFAGLVSADERKIRQVLYNLLSNAVKFSSRGGKIELTAKTIINGEADSSRKNITKQNDMTNDKESKSSEEYKVIHNTAEFYEQNESAFIEVSIQDSGLGIDQKDLERIFEPFVQVDGSMSKRAQGTGLGLAICKNIIEAHGGSIWAESSGKGCGSKFTFTIPIEGEISG
jgi:signal transduction histidine kinase